MHDVVIAGAGPVGLFLACELSLAGCSVLVLEREREPGSPWKSAPLGMRGLSAGSMETFYRRGMLPAILAASGADDYPGDSGPVRPRQVGHFAGLMLDPARVDPATLSFRLPGPATEGVLTYLEAVEGVLTERAVKLGVEIRRGVPVTGLTEDAETVVAHCGDREFPARWLVGCDGGRSTVRGLAGFDFAGTEPLLTGYLMLATLDDPARLRPGFNLTPAGMNLRTGGEKYLGLMDFDGGAFDRAETPTREHLQAVLRRISGTDVTLTAVEHVSTFTDRARQVTTYRRGRVLLAGDAAHIHSPLGGQGLNTGIGDAVNLGWKLAATVRGDAPDGLLDTYTTERHPIGARVLDWTRAQVAVMRPDPYSQAVQALVRDLISTGDGTTSMFHRFDTMTGLAVRYDLGLDDPLAGRDAPDFRLADGTRLGDLLADGRGVLLDFGAGQPLRDAAAGWAGRVRYVPGPASDEPGYGDFGYGAVLVRPDGVVAWAGDGDPGAFEPAATRWFGGRDVP
jgi:2-polyprenyl-6-methoxyphenol hydroxylase-like FAD-dependent oxidoreductase